MKYLYYPGCSLRGTAVDYHESLLAVAPILGLELEEIKDWRCCGATAVKSTDEKLAHSLPARTFAAGPDGLDILMPCPSCSNNHLHAGEKIARDSSLKERYGLKGIPAVKHLLEVLAFDLREEEIRKRIVRPLEGLRALPYYGCLVIRPYALGGRERMENPRAMERLIRATWARPVLFPQRTDCCGGGLVFTKEKVAFRLAARLLARANEISPDCLIVACPLCHFILDARQDRIEREVGAKVGLPVLYITQWLGLALGIAPEKLGLDRLITPATKLLDKIYKVNRPPEFIPSPPGVTSGHAYR